MDQVKLSSKGQLVIPRHLRAALSLHAGDTLEVVMVDRSLVLTPLSGASALDRLYGLFADCDLIGDREAEHRAEIDGDAGLRP